MTEKKTAPRQVRKILGADIELANFVEGVEDNTRTGDIAARLLLRQIDGVSAGGPSGPASGAWVPAYAAPVPYAYSSTYSPSYSHSYSPSYSHSYSSTASSASSSAAGYDPQDRERKFLPKNGCCCYIDLSHLELCLPEVVSAHDYTAGVHALFRTAAAAQAQVNALLPDEARIRVLANNSDHLSNSFGSHLNLLITREAWDDLFRYRLQHLLFLASFQVSAIVFTGLGKVGAENGQIATDYQLSQRADFMETLCGSQTTYRRPIVNARDEDLCGPGTGLARLHCIFFDTNLCHVANFLKAGTMQIVLALIEAEALDLTLLLDDPVASVVRFSHDPTLARTQPLMSGERVTAVELQLRFLALARKAYGQGLLAVVDDVESILDLWEDTLHKLAAGDLDALRGRLDWVLKRHALESCLARRPELDWQSDEIRYLDLLYSSLDPNDGLYLAYEQAGLVERLVTDGEIEQLRNEPPAETRAWTRAQLLRGIPARDIERIDWDEIRLVDRESDRWNDTFTVRLPDPRQDTRADNEALLRASTDAEAFARALAARDEDEDPHATVPPLTAVARPPH